jgi:hypothetical protein
MKNFFDTPVLFLIFKRAETTAKVFEQIRRIKPKFLFVAADGPRAHVSGEALQCETVRKIATNIDWDCELKTLFRDSNLGCGKAVSEGITWFFEQVEQGIILEDDTLPDTSFFMYCDKILNLYRNDNEIMHINGSNQLLRDKLFDPVFKKRDTYYFTRYPSIWGWATWRRAWNMYRYDVVNINIDNIINSAIYSEEQKRIFNASYLRMLNPQTWVDTWDFQWLLSFWANHGLAIYPGKNLVKNIGINDDATHRGVNLLYGDASVYSLDTNKITESPLPKEVDSKKEQNLFNSLVIDKRNWFHVATNPHLYLGVKLQQLAGKFKKLYK